MGSLSHHKLFSAVKIKAALANHQLTWSKVLQYHYVSSRLNFTTGFSIIYGFGANSCGICDSQGILVWHNPHGVATVLYVLVA